MTVAIVIVVVIVAAVVAGLIVRSRRSADTVDSFRRGLDALSPEARRPVIDQVQRVSRPEDELDRPDGSLTADADDDTDHETDHDADDEIGDAMDDEMGDDVDGPGDPGGARGT